MKRYIVIAVCALIGFGLIWISTSDTGTSVATGQSTTTTFAEPIQESVPTFAENYETVVIPNPCESLTIENVARFVPSSKVRGPLLQNAYAPSKSCEWTPVDEQLDTPRLGVSIAGSLGVFDSLEKSATEQVEIGTSGYILNEYQTALGGAACGRTLVSETDTFSFVVALCKANNEIPTSQELIELATNVLNSLG